jgi:hypothetical protein
MEMHKGSYASAAILPAGDGAPRSRSFGKMTVTTVPIFDSLFTIIAPRVIPRDVW